MKRHYFWSLILVLFISSPPGQTSIQTRQNQPAPKCDLEKMKWNPIPFDHDEVEHPECRPQILYSWLTSDDILDPKDPLWPFRRGRAFMFRSPLGTFLYGRFSYRVKLKPGVRFKVGAWNDAHFYCSHDEQEKKNTIYIAHDRGTGFSEYVICSPDVVESWSFGMPEHLSEMKRERNLIESRGAHQVDGYLNPNSLAGTGQYQGKPCDRCFQKYTIHDARHSATKEDLDEAFETMNRWIIAKKGKVHSLADQKTYTEGSEVARHFATTLALPFHGNIPLPPYYGAIRVEKAAAGALVATDKAGSFCNGKSQCEYKIARKFLGESGAIPSFDFAWSCVDPLTGKSVAKPTLLKFRHENLEGHVFSVRCDSSGKGTFSEEGESRLTSANANTSGNSKVEKEAPKAPANEPVEFGTIQIVKAMAGELTVTDKAGSFCDGGSRCEYKIARKFLGGQGPVPSFSLIWSCVNPETKKAAKNRFRVNLNKSDLEGHSFTILCDDHGEGSVRENGEKLAKFSVISPQPPVKKAASR